MRRAVLASASSQPLLPKLATIVGPKHVVTDPDILAPALSEWRGLYTGRTQALVRPGSTEEVAAILKLAHESGTPVVPQSGNTGGVGGQIPDQSGRAILISMARLNRVRDRQPLSNMMTVEAGVLLQDVQAEALAMDRYYPLSLPSEGSCMIGGNLATNAGGTGVIAYGNTRDLVLGLEVVLPDGRIWNGLSGLRKDNAGYEMKHLFIGSEGTLGIITAATLKVFPRPRSQVTAFVGVASPAKALQLLARAQAGSGGTVTTFEVMPRLAIDMVLKNGAQVRDPLAALTPGTCCSRSPRRTKRACRIRSRRCWPAPSRRRRRGCGARELARPALEPLEDPRGPPFAQGVEGASIKHDVSVPVADVPAFMDEALAALADRFPESRPCPFGHLGDGNIHFNVTQPVGWEKARFLALYDEMNEVVFDVVKRYRGSIAAEHGVGQHKRKLLPRYKDPVALDLMRTLKAAIDPKGIMNPGKVL